jgi:hypothetical protein
LTVIREHGHDDTVRRAFLGAALVVAGIAAFIEAHSHRPESNYLCPEGHEPCIISEGLKVHLRLATRGLSGNAYDLLRIGAWALVIFGAVLIVAGLIAYRAEMLRR